ncbi:MAG: carboxypeptidase-like regulatory domain-containing protein [Salinivirgaceae bacterium]|nr:carboxypeptidase-like regulatory domain-containing protein [Salinivirgaceae bacterium]
MRLTAIIIGFFLICVNGYIHCQSLENPIVIDGIISDKNTNKTLAYANVSAIQSNNGTASNMNGYFKLENIAASDTIVISYIGYEKLYITGKDWNVKKYYLVPKSELLFETSVYSNNDFLYEKFIILKKHKHRENSIAKTYFYLNTIISDSIVELIEAFYNGEFKGYDTKDLYFENAQIAVKPYKCESEKYYFISSETSKLFSKYSLFSKNENFPRNPFELNFSQLKKYYDLKLLSVYKDNGSKIYEISFIPQRDKNMFFEGVAWIDITKNYLQKVDFVIKNSHKVPFLTFGNINKIHSIDIFLSKTFKLEQGDVRLSSMNYDIEMIYENFNGYKYSPRIHTYIKPFDYSNTFEPTLFDFGQTLHEDYRNASITSDDDFFWSNREFYINTKTKDNVEFIKKYKIASSHQDFDFSKSWYKNGLIQYSFIEWDETRFVIHQEKIFEEKNPNLSEEFNSDKYNFNTKLYLDYNIIHDSVYCITKSILDPINTYYHFNIDNVTLVFFNIYWDLLEIERRELIKSINALEQIDYVLVKQLYYKSVEKYKSATKLYLKETQRGKDLFYLKKWNDYVYENLKINNFDYFNVAF